MNEEETEITKHEPSEELSLARKTARMGMLIHRYRTANARTHGAVGDPTRGQGRVLALLAVKPETTQRELSFLLDMRQQSLSELLAKLEEKGFVTREKSEQDGRVTVVKLTEAGAAAAPTAQQMGNHDDVLDCLSDEEQEQFEALVDKVIASLEEKLVGLGVDPYAPPREPRGREERGGDRGPHGDRDDRGFRGPRGDRGDRDDRGPRGPRDDRGPRAPRGDRDDRGFHGQRGGGRDRGRDEGFRSRDDRGPRRDRRGWNDGDDHLRQA